MTGPWRGRALIPVGLLLLALSGCAANPIAEQYKEGDSKGYVAGDGSVTVIAEEDRAEAIRFTGSTENSEQIDSSEMLGSPVVVNFWYAGCAPCRAEAPQLKELAATYTAEGVQFVGINVYDQAETILAFNETYGITYPSIIDVDNGSAKLAFAGSVPPQAVPTTLVLDKHGRVAARILGQLPEGAVLSTLIRDALDE